MTIYDERIAAVEKDIVAMKRDIIYKLDDTNSAVTIIKGVIGSQGQDIKEIRHQVRVVNAHLDEIDTRLEGLKEEIRTIKDHQDVQGQGITDIRRQQEAQGQGITDIGRQQEAQGQGITDIGRHLDTLEEKFEQRFISLEGKFAQVLQLLTALRDKAE